MSDTNKKPEVHIVKSENQTGGITAHTVNIGMTPKLSYSFSGIEKLKDGEYVRKLTIQPEGNAPFYNPILYLRFNKVINKAEYKFLGGVGVLFNVRTNSNLKTKELNKNEYVFNTKEFTPGAGMQFLFYNDSEFDISVFKINDQEIAVPTQKGTP